MPGHGGGGLAGAPRQPAAEPAALGGGPPRPPAPKSTRRATGGSHAPAHAARVDAPRVRRHRPHRRQLFAPVALGHHRQVEEQLVEPRVLDRREPVPLEHNLVRRHHAQQVDAAAGAVGRRRRRRDREHLVEDAHLDLRGRRRRVLRKVFVVLHREFVRSTAHKAGEPTAPRVLPRSPGGRHRHPLPTPHPAASAGARPGDRRIVS